jgi:hypothetical protein
MSPEMTESKMLTNWPKPVEHVTQCHRFDKMLPKEVFLHYIAHTITTWKCKTPCTRGPRSKHQATLDSSRVREAANVVLHHVHIRYKPLGPNSRLTLNLQYNNSQMIRYSVSQIQISMRILPCGIVLSIHMFQLLIPVICLEHVLNLV